MSRNYSRSHFLLAALAIAAGCSPSRPPVTLSISGATNAGPTVAAAGQHVVVTWAATANSETNIYAASSTDGGATFTPPVRVNDIDGDARVSGEQAPRAVIGDDVVIAWVSKLTGTSRVRLARSKDGGRSFEPAITPHAEDLSGARGWTSISLDRDHAVHAVWLDGRDAQAGIAPGAGHDHAMRQDIYQVVLRPDGTRLDARVATNVCFCCKTAVSATGEGTTYVAWRHVYPTNLRDIAIARSSDGGRTFSAPVRVSEDHWQIEGCPEDGPSIAATDGVVHVVWPTMTEGANPRKAVFYTYSTDGGQTFAPRTRLDLEDAGSTFAAHPQISLAGSGLAVAWEESTGSGRRIRVQQIVWTGTSWAPLSGPARIVSPENERSTYPSVAGTSRGAVVAWTVTRESATEIRVARIQ